MTMIRALWARVALPLVAFAISPAAADPIRIEPKGPYIHRGTGFVFPVAVGEFRRTSVIEYDVAAEDISAGYNLVKGDRQIVVTIYVYPAPVPAPASADSMTLQREGLCLDHFEGIKASIVQKHDQTVLDNEGDIASPSSAFSAKGKRAVFSFTDIFEGKAQTLRSEADLFCYVAGKWLIAYRTTAPVSVDYQAELAKLMAGLRWPDFG